VSRLSKSDTANVAVESEIIGTMSFPSGWEATTLGEACEKPQYGFTASAEARDTGTRFLRISDLMEGNLNWNDVPFCHCLENEIDRYRLKNGDLVVARIGATTGRTSLAVSPPKAVFASYLIRLRPKADINPFFLYFFTQSSAYWNWINSSKDSNLKGGVNAGVLTRIELPKPSQPEQQKIAAVLWKIQKAVDIEGAIVRNARGLKKSLLRRLFTHGLRGEPLKETEIGSVPESWDVIRISDVARVSSGGTPDRAKNAYWQNGTIPWVKTGEINYRVIRDTGEKITEEGLQNSAARLYPTGTLLIAMYGQGVTRGRVAILGIEAAINQACGAFVLNGGVVTEYLYHYLSFAYERLRNLAHGANQQNLNARLVSQLQFPKPSEDEQREIAGILQTVDRKIDIHESKKRSLQDLFKTMLHKLMTAQIRVNDLDIDTNDIEAA
jgi:type I restriction enzyme S subunit